jgi:hypothetical protein
MQLSQKGERFAKAKQELETVQLALASFLPKTESGSPMPLFPRLRWSQFSKEANDGEKVLGCPWVIVEARH